MAEFTADTQFEDFIVGIGRARMHGRLTDEMARQICAGINDPLPDLPAADDECDLIKVELVIRLARARGRGRLPGERMEEFLRPLSETLGTSTGPVPDGTVLLADTTGNGLFDSFGVDARSVVPSTLPAPPERRDSIGPELIYEQAAAEDDEDEPLADEDDVMDVDEGEVTPVERESDTDPPPPADS